MHDDKRNYHYRNNSAVPPSRASGTSRGAQNNRDQAVRGTAPQGNTVRRPQNNGTMRQGQPMQNMQARRTVSSGNTARQRVNTQMQTHTAPAPVPAAPKTSGTLTWLKKTFAVDKTILEERDLVREKGSIDYIFLIVALVLLAFGTIMVYSASYAYSKNEYDDSYYIIFRQFIFIFVGFVAMFFAVRIPPEGYRKLAIPAFIGCFFLLCLVPLIGKEHNGAKRWLSLGFTEIQPSEFMKLGLVLMLAWFFDRYYERITDKKNIVRSSFFGVFVPLVITGVACVLVLIESHLSGTIIMFLIGIIIIFASGAPIRLLVALGAVGVSVLGIYATVTPHTKRRLDFWLHPELDPLGAGYQTLQGLYAIGSGGLFGEGLGKSYQKHLFVKEPQNDFIFTIVCEELGFIGAFAVIALFVLLAWRGFVIAMKAPDTFSSMVVLGIVGKVIIQALLNIAVVTNSIPNTGISLPFFSYGGSSLCVLMLEMGIVLSISRFSKQRKS